MFLNRVRAHRGIYKWGGVAEERSCRRGGIISRSDSENDNWRYWYAMCVKSSVIIAPCVSMVCA